MKTLLSELHKNEVVILRGSEQQAMILDVRSIKNSYVQVHYLLESGRAYTFTGYGFDVLERGNENAFRFKATEGGICNALSGQEWTQGKQYTCRVCGQSLDFIGAWFGSDDTYCSKHLPGWEKDRKQLLDATLEAETAKKTAR